MTEVDKVTDKVIGQGGLLSLLYFDIHGSKRETIQQLGVGFVQKLLKEPGVVYARGQIEEPLMNEDMYSTSIEVRILTKTLSDLARICSSYSPFSVEVLKPTEVKLGLDQVHDLLIDISTVTYEYKKHIIEKTATKEDLEKYKKNLENKAKLGKILMEKKKK